MSRGALRRGSYQPGHQPGSRRLRELTGVSYPTNRPTATNVNLLNNGEVAMSRDEVDKPSGGAVRRFALRYWVAITLVVLLSLIHI